MLHNTVELLPKSGGLGICSLRFSNKNGSVKSDTRVGYTTDAPRLIRNERSGRCADRSEISATLGPREAKSAGVRPIMTLAA